MIAAPQNVTACHPVSAAAAVVQGEAAQRNGANSFGQFLCAANGQPAPAGQDVATPNDAENGFEEQLAAVVEKCFKQLQPASGQIKSDHPTVRSHPFCEARSGKTGRTAPEKKPASFRETPATQQASSGGGSSQQASAAGVVPQATVPPAVHAQRADRARDAKPQSAPVDITSRKTERAIVPATAAPEASPQAATQQSSGPPVPNASGTRSVEVASPVVDAAAASKTPQKVDFDAGIAKLEATTSPAPAKPPEQAAAAPRVHEPQPPLDVESLSSPAPNKLEVALRGGSAGWLNIRAELASDGGVHAVLRTAPEAATALRSQVTDLQSYLGAHSIPLSGVAVVSPSRVPSGAGFDAGSGGTNSGSDQSQRRRTAEPNRRDVSRQAEAVSGLSFREAQPGTLHATGGSWLSVRV